MKGNVIMREEDVTIIICCAGMGTRLGIGSTKSMIDIYGKPLIVLLLEVLQDYSDLRIVVGYQAEKVIKTVLKYRKDVTFVFNYDFEKTGVVYSLNKALKFCRKYVVEIDGDILINNNNLKNIISYPEECVAITQKYSENPILVDIDNGKITSISKNKGNYEWTGIAKLKSEKFISTKEYIYEIIEDFLPISALEVESRDIDTPYDYDEALEWYKYKKENKNA